MTIAFPVIGIDLCISEDLLMYAVLETTLTSNMTSLYSTHPLKQEPAEHLKGNKICSVVQVISVEADFD